MFQQNPNMFTVCMYI